MRVGLLVPCYVDQLRPGVGLATLALLEGQGLEVDFPTAQTCCGQPLLNAGGVAEARRLAFLGERRRCAVSRSEFSSASEMSATFSPLRRSMT